MDFTYRRHRFSMNAVGFVPEPNCGRGTIGIIWSCLTTIFLTTWTATHSEIKSNIRNSKHERRGFSLLCLLFPEVLSAIAVTHFVDAYVLRRAIRRIDGWGSCSLKQAFLVVIDGVCIDDEGSEPEVLQRTRFVDLAQSGRIMFDYFPNGAEIDSRAKADWIAKLVAVLQATWFLATILSRIIGDLTVTPLEDITAASACCGLAAFLLFFRCPQDVQERFPIKLKAEDPRSGPRNTKTSGELPGLESSHTAILSIVVLAAFTGIHLAAWNYPFPSIVEIWMWRAAALSTFVTGAVFIRFIGSLEVDFVLPGLIPYTLCRLITFTLAFAAFRHSPAEVYQRPSWSAYWGHIGS